MISNFPVLKLRNDAAIPHVGLGTSPMDDRQAETTIATAIELGYRLIDTAENYGNERGVGRGIKASQVPREEVFLTTKFNKRWHGEQLVRQACGRSAERLGVDYIDLLLIHWPNPAQDRYVDAWRGMIRLQEEGLVKAIGTSNFKPSHLRRIIDATGVAPEVNQIELNPRVTRDEARAFHAEHGIVTESWSPLGGQGGRLLREPVITDLARRHGKSPAQIVLRWHTQLGLVPIPKSSNRDRLAANLGIFDFDLSGNDIESISALDRGEAAAADSDAYGH